MIDQLEQTIKRLREQSMQNEYTFQGLTTYQLTLGVLWEDLKNIPLTKNIRNVLVKRVPALVKNSVVAVVFGL